MISRAFAIVLAIMIGTPLFAAGVLAFVPPAAAMLVCLAVAAAGVVGTVAGVRLLTGGAPSRRAEGLHRGGQIS